jgi:hypothetical protein
VVKDAPLVPLLFVSTIRFYHQSYLYH